MTLIPLISAIMTAQEATTAPAGPAVPLPRNSYGSDAGRHPVAALFAVSLPAALVVAVALSPMIIVTEPVSEPIRGKLIELYKPVDPPPPEKKTEKKAAPESASTTETVDPLVKTDLTDNVVESGPKVLGPVIPVPGDIYVPPADPPAPPKFVLADLDPRFAGAFQPDYPAREQRGGIEGAAKVRVLIGIDGRVKAVELVSTDSRGFFEETKRRALAKWRFKPATRGGVPEESWKVMTVRFEIKNA